MRGCVASTPAKRLYEWSDMLLECYKLYDDVKLPKLATFGSACFDIFAHLIEDKPISLYEMSNKKVKRTPEWRETEDGESLQVYLDPADRILVPTGIIFNIPCGHSVRIHPRSSISLKKGLMMPNGEGIIDYDYYHQTYVMLINSSADTVYIEHGERVAQGELIRTKNYELKETFSEPKQITDRVGGFGSTGIK